MYATVLNGAMAPLNLLKAIFGAIEKISDVEKAKKMLTEKLILRLDHIAFGCTCEYPEDFGSSFQSIYKAFRLKFNYEATPRKPGNMHM